MSRKKLGEEDMDLPVTLTPEEFMDRATALAEIELEIHKHDEALAEMKADFKARELALLARRAALAAIVRGRAETRKVLVERWAYFDQGLYVEIRTDNGEVLKGTRRALSEEERQGQLDLTVGMTPEEVIARVAKQGRASRGKQEEETRVDD